MIQFYSPEIESNGKLPEGESAHCVRVLRMKVNDEIRVVDGKGNIFLCRITDANPKGAELEILEKISDHDDDPQITLIVAPTKNFDRMEWMVEKCIEIGINEICFVKCERSERKHIRKERVEKVAVAAMKQSLKSKLPVISFFEDFRSMLSYVCKKDGGKFMGYCDDEYKRLEFAKELIPDNNVIILIGPEGDFVHREVQDAVNVGFIPVTFGKMRLRTETAAIYSVTAVHVVNSMASA